MTKRELTESERTTIINGLQVASERFKENAVSMSEFADKEGNEVCRRLAQQFERQRKESLDLVRLIEDAESIEVTV